MRAELRARRDLVCKRLDQIHGLECLWPEATMFVMLDIRGTGLSAQDFANGLLDRHDVSVLPADAFGPGARGHVRVSLSVGREKLAEACERIAAYADELVA
jgi:arginine:pyruvate transaminase